MSHNDIKELNYDDVIAQQAQEMEHQLSISGQAKKHCKSPKVKKLFDSLDYFKEKEEEDKKHHLPGKV